MPKRESETKEERRERKRLKKEAKLKRRRSSAEQANGKDATSDIVVDPSVFVRKRMELAVSLLPISLGDTLKSIEDSLRELLLKYSDGISGILLAFDNVKILGDGMILNEFAHIHYKVAVDTLVFAPRAGCRLRGIVTDSFHSHLSLVVHHYFNASIPSQDMYQAGFEFDGETEQWYRKAKDDSSGSRLSNGNMVTFTCEKIHESGGIISIAGIKPFMVSTIQSDLDS